MVVHPQKTEAVWVFRNNQKDPPSDHVTYDGTLIEWVQCVKLFAVLIDCQLSFAPHGEEVVKRFNGKIGLLKNMRFMPRDPLLQFYSRVVLPQVLYGVLVWGSTHKTLWDKIE